MTVRPSSKRVYTGYQYTPVDSIASCSTCCSSNQLSSDSKSAVMVPKVRVSFVEWPFAAVSMMVTTTDF